MSEVFDYPRIISDQESNCMTVCELEDKIDDFVDDKNIKIMVELPDGTMYAIKDCVLVGDGTETIVLIASSRLDMKG